MPPKKKKASTAEVDLVAAKWHIAQWRFRNDADSWTAYSDADNQLIESAFLRGQETANLGAYVVDTKQMVQAKVSDQSKQRIVKRFVLGMKPQLTSSPKKAKAAEVPPPTPPSAETQPPEMELLPPDPPKAKPAPKKKGNAGGVTINVEDTEDDGPEPMLKRYKKDSTPSSSSKTSLSRIHSGSTVREGTPTKQSTGSFSSVDASAVFNLLDVTRNGSTKTFEIFGIDLFKRSASPTANLPPKNVSPTKKGKLATATGGSKMPPAAVAAIVAKVIAQTPPLNKMSLGSAADKMFPSTKKWLERIGRKPGEQSMKITMEKPLDAVPKSARIPLTEKCTVPASKLQQLAGEAVLTWIGTKPEPSLVEKRKMTNQEEVDTQRMMVSGPALVLYDENYNPISRPPTVVMCSIPGINFAYSNADMKAFLHREEDDGPIVINKPVAVQRMVIIWAHVLVTMDDLHRVQFPVLCGLGCGAFRGKYGATVPRLWAEALHTVLASRDFAHIEAVFVSLPTFGTDNNFAPFKAMFKAKCEHTPLKTPCIFVEDAGMLSLATTIASCGGSSTGVLNPSDVEAIRKGSMGMFWDGGHIALEEVLAMQTTLLLQHVGVNPALFKDPSRQTAIALK